MNRTRVAVIGAGHLGRIHARLLRQSEAVTIVGVADPAPEARVRVVRELELPTFESWRPLADLIDAAIVATPTVGHHEVTCGLLRRGIHVLVEKPMATNVAEADQMVDLAVRHGCLLQVGHIERFNAAWQAIDGQAREPKYIDAIRTSAYSGRSVDIGVVLDVMIHDLDLLLSLTKSRPVDVQALGACIVGPHEDIAQARLTFANGCVANLSASRVSSVMQRSMQIFCPAAHLALDFAQGRATVVRPQPQLLQGELDVRLMPPEARLALKDELYQDYLYREELPVRPVNALLEELENFIGCVQTGGRPRVDGHQGREVLQVAETILGAIAAHLWDGTAGGRVGPAAFRQDAVHGGRRPVFPLGEKTRKAG